MDVDHLEKAIELLRNPLSGATVEAKKEANDYLLKLVEENYASYLSFYPIESESELTKYWLLHALCDIVTKHWDKLSIDDQKER